MLATRLIWIVAATLALVAAIVQGNVMITEPSTSTVAVAVGEYVNLKCVDPDGGEVEWIMDSIFGELIIEDNPPFSLTAAEVNGYTLFLTIEGATIEDAADYTCRSVDDPADQQVVTLTVHEAGAAPPAGWVVPVIDVREGQDTIEVEVGKELSLKCKGGNKDSLLEFRHDGDVIVGDTQNIITNAIVEDVVSVVMLSRINAVTGYSGTYTCRDVNYPDPRDEVRVDIIEHPSTRVEIIEPSGMQTKVMNGDNFNLKCQSSLQTTIIWYHGDEQLSDQSGGFIIGTSDNIMAHTRLSVLTKEGAEFGDAGKYRCVNADSPQDEAFIEVAVKAEGGDDDSSFLDLFGGAPSVVSSVLLVSLAAICMLL